LEAVLAENRKLRTKLSGKGSKLLQISLADNFCITWSDPYEGQANQSDQSGSEDSLYHLLQEFIAENNSLKESNRID